MYFEQFKLVVQFDDVYLFFLQFILYHWNKYTSVYLAVETWYLDTVMASAKTVYVEY